MSKKIHGWSKRNQGGFSKGGPVKQIYRKPQKIDQTQTLQQAWVWSCSHFVATLNVSNAQKKGF